MMAESSLELELQRSDRTVERIANLKHQTFHFHERIIDEIGGSTGLRDEPALDSALAAPFATFPGEDLHQTVYDKAAALMRSLSLNHPFVDGNKRVSLGMTGSFLLEHGLGFRESLVDDEIVDFCLDIAQGGKKIEEISSWLETNSDRAS